MQTVCSIYGAMMGQRPSGHREKSKHFIMNSHELFVHDRDHKTREVRG